jgi:hypothetical protein
MRRAKRRLFNLFAFSLLAFAIYLNFFYKEEQPGTLRSEPAKQSTQNTSNEVTAKTITPVKK